MAGAMRRMSIALRSLRQIAWASFTLALAPLTGQNAVDITHADPLRHIDPLWSANSSLPQGAGV